MKLLRAVIADRALWEIVAMIGGWLAFLLILYIGFWFVGVINGQV